MLDGCQHNYAVDKFEKYYQQNPLVGDESQFRCDCGAVHRVKHADYYPGGSKAKRLVAPPPEEAPDEEKPEKSRRGRR